MPRSVPRNFGFTATPTIWRRGERQRPSRRGPQALSAGVIGAREDGCKELLAVDDGYRESEDSWAVAFRDLRDRGMNEPKFVTGDGALGAWAALRNLFPPPASNVVGCTMPTSA